MISIIHYEAKFASNHVPTGTLHRAAASCAKYASLAERQTSLKKALNLKCFFHGANELFVNRLTVRILKTSLLFVIGFFWSCHVPSVQLFSPKKALP